MPMIDTKDINASFVSEKLPEVAKALREEGVKSVNAEQQISSAVQAANEENDKKVSAATEAGATGERKRIAKIQEMAMAGSEELVAKAIEGGHSPEQFAMDQLAFMKKNSGKSGAKSALETAEALAKGVTPTVGAGDVTQPNTQAKATADVTVLKAAGVIR